MDEVAPGVSRVRHRTVRVLLGSVVAAIAGWVVVSSAGGLGEAFGAVRRMRVGFVALAVGLTMLRLGLYSLQVAWLGRRAGRMGTATAFGLALVVYGFGAVTPAAPVEGLAIANAELRARGRTRREAALTLGFSKWFAQRTFYVVAALDVFVVVGAGHLSLADGWPLLAGAGAVVVLLVASGMLVRGERFSVAVSTAARHVPLRRWDGDASGDAVRQWHADAMAFVGSPRRRVPLALVSAGAVLAEAGTLWATTHATGFHIHPELVVLACTVATVASWVPLLPSGLGIVDVAVPAVLHRFGVPLAAGVAATLVFRAIGTVLPALGGTLAIGVLRARRPIV